jgi:hypothetical protein
MRILRLASHCKPGHPYNFCLLLWTSFLQEVPAPGRPSCCHQWRPHRRPDISDAHGSLGPVLTSCRGDHRSAVINFPFRHSACLVWPRGPGHCSVICRNCFLAVREAIATSVQLRLAEPSASHLPCAHQLLPLLIDIQGHDTLVSYVEKEKVHHKHLFAYRLGMRAICGAQANGVMTAKYCSRPALTRQCGLAAPACFRAYPHQKLNAHRQLCLAVWAAASQDRRR